MKLLLLNGHGMNINVENAKLKIRDGRYDNHIEPENYMFRPKRVDIDNIVIYGRSGNLSIEAIRWLVKHNIAITILDWNGKLLTTILPPEGVQVKTRFAQYSSYRNDKLRLELAKKFIIAKIERTKSVLKFLKLKYENIEYDFSEEEFKLKISKDVKEINLIEARVAGKYWKFLIKLFPEKYEFETRKKAGRRWGAGDQINCMLNYGYAILEAECLRAINSAGLDSHVGFLHEMNPSKNSLAYDLQEPFRFLIDLAIISAIEKNIMEKRDFIRTENYNLRLRPSGAKKLIGEINVQFNSKVQYKGQASTWSYVLLSQVRDLAFYLLGKIKDFDLTQPTANIIREDTKEIREKILNISYSEWKKRGFSKGTLNPMKKRAMSNKPFKLNKHVKERILKEF